jgi:hypothetical protein
MTEDVERPFTGADLELEGGAALGGGDRYDDAVIVLAPQQRDWPGPWRVSGASSRWTSRVRRLGR